MIFVFVATCAERNPLPVSESQPSGRIFEVRSLPGNLIGVGRTHKEAIDKLIGLIEWTREDEASFDDWFRESWAYASALDVQLYEQVVGGRRRQLQPPKQVNEQFGYDMAPAFA